MIINGYDLIRFDFVLDWIGFIPRIFFLLSEITAEKNLEPRNLVFFFIHSFKIKLNSDLVIFFCLFDPFDPFDHQVPCFIHTHT